MRDRAPSAATWVCRTEADYDACRSEQSESARARVPRRSTEARAISRHAELEAERPTYPRLNDRRVYFPRNCGPLESFSRQTKSISSPAGSRYSLSVTVNGCV